MEYFCGISKYLPQNSVGTDHLEDMNWMTSDLDLDAGVGGVLHTQSVRGVVRKLHNKHVVLSFLQLQ